MCYPLHYFNNHKFIASPATRCRLNKAGCETVLEVCRLFTQDISPCIIDVSLIFMRFLLWQLNKVSFHLYGHDQRKAFYYSLTLSASVPAPAKVSSLSSVPIFSAGLFYLNYLQVLFSLLFHWCLDHFMLRLIGWKCPSTSMLLEPDLHDGPEQQ